MVNVKKDNEEYQHHSHMIKELRNEIKRGERVNGLHFDWNNKFDTIDHDDNQDQQDNQGGSLGINCNQGGSLGINCNQGGSLGINQGESLGINQGKSLGINQGGSLGINCNQGGSLGHQDDYSKIQFQERMKLMRMEYEYNSSFVTGMNNTSAPAAGMSLQSQVMEMRNEWKSVGKELAGIVLICCSCLVHVNVSFCDVCILILI